MKETSHPYTSDGTKVKIICQGQGQILRSHLKKKKTEKTVIGVLTNTACWKRGKW